MSQNFKGRHKSCFGPSFLSKPHEYRPGYGFAQRSIAVSPSLMPAWVSGVSPDTQYIPSAVALSWWRQVSAAAGRGAPQRTRAISHPVGCPGAFVDSCALLDV